MRRDVMKIPMCKVGLTGLLIILLLTALSGCGWFDDDDNDDGAPTPTSGNGENGTVVEDVTVTIGNLTDKTGVSSNALSIIDQALKDVVEYANETNMIPGVKLEIIEYDDQYDPSRDIPGYEWLKQRGADLIWSPVPPAVPTLLSRVNADDFIMFAATANMKPGELEGGRVFSLGITPKNEAYTLLKWLPENDPDFPKDRPAKIGGAAWNDGYSNFLFGAAKEYCDAHPDQYDWVKGYLTDFSFIWSTEVEGLKDCDYVFVPSPPQVFIRDYRKAGYEAKFLGSDIHTAFLGLITRSNLWDEIDGSYFIRSSRWYNETGPIIDIINHLLDTKHSEAEANAMRAEGCGYLGAKQEYLILDIIRETAERYGPENINAQTIYETAIDWSFAYEGLEDFNNFNETKRISQNYYAVYEASAADQTLYRAHTEWLPQVEAP